MKLKSDWPNPCLVFSIFFINFSFRHWLKSRISRLFFLKYHKVRHVFGMKIFAKEKEIFKLSISFYLKILFMSMKFYELPSFSSLFFSFSRVFKWCFLLLLSIQKFLLNLITIRYLPKDINQTKWVRDNFFLCVCGREKEKQFEDFASR